MPKLTVVFEYPDGASLIEAKRMFSNGSIPNLVGVEEYDAIEAYENKLGEFIRMENAWRRKVEEISADEVAGD